MCTPHCIPLYNLWTIDDLAHLTIPKYNSVLVLWLLQGPISVHDGVKQAQAPVFSVYQAGYRNHRQLLTALYTGRSDSIWRTVLYSNCGRAESRDCGTEKGESIDSSNQTHRLSCDLVFSKQLRTSISILFKYPCIILREQFGSRSRYESFIEKEYYDEWYMYHKIFRNIQ